MQHLVVKLAIPLLSMTAAVHSSVRCNLSHVQRLLLLQVCFVAYREYHSNDNSGKSATMLLGAGLWLLTPSLQLSLMSSSHTKS